MDYRRWPPCRASPESATSWPCSGYGGLWRRGVEQANERVPYHRPDICSFESRRGNYYIFITFNAKVVAVMFHQYQSSWVVRPRQTTFGVGGKAPLTDGGDRRKVSLVPFSTCSRRASRALPSRRSTFI